MTLFVDGFGMAGKVAELTPPKLTMNPLRGGNVHCWGQHPIHTRG
uniref:Uncharacterized protein n=1 Tax=Candidatus Kentrum sp. FM TaxID=2126340 RepID=A0A450W4Q5_9GAMM|nr:MAG: hypothetical protein BECKFM1743A_GA0114220_1002310 [Candidatus Kentron sp. FM]VFJ58844.1 MAG: hypothetical protein BECKFM1743C_GA0114222_102352 [Candidatus Kentron sp. FM]VFK12026.1 MAG: hypothetical protein BECKFM1743B_GA0114221_102212 [Candidatus Kentron sp. FM]